MENKNLNKDKDNKKEKKSTTIKSNIVLRDLSSELNKKPNNKINKKNIVNNLNKTTKINVSQIVKNNKINQSENKVFSFDKNINNTPLKTQSEKNDYKNDYSKKEINISNKNVSNRVFDKSIKENNSKNLSDKKMTKWIIKNNKPHKGVAKDKPKNYNNEIIYLENVNKYVTNGYNNLHILKNINLKINQGEFVVIYGPSGSGKTTLLTLISALDRPTTGICYLVDSNTLGVSEHGLTVLRRKNVGYIFQQYGLLNDLTVYDNIKIAASLQKDTNKRIDIDELLKKVGMYEYRHKKASTLSGGQAQRVAICRAIVKNPKILFGDEPTGAVHVDATKDILKIFKSINREYNTTIVLVTHNDKILEIASRILKVDDGKITADYNNSNMKTIDEVNW